MIEYSSNISPVEVNLLRKSVKWEEISLNALEKALANTAFTVCARSEGQVVGMARVLFDFCSIAYITDVIVLPEFQGQGIGREMTQQLVDFVSENAPEKTDVYLYLCASKGKEAFYKKLGFIQRPVGALGAGMTKRIKGCPKTNE